MTQETHQIISDGSDGAIVVWIDRRDGGNDVYSQRVDGAGASQWTPNGMVVCASGESRDPQIASHGLGGAIVTWADGRNDSTLLDIYAQRIQTEVTAVVEPGGPVGEFVGPFPNPASKVIGFNVATARAGMLRVKVMDVAGRLVRCIHDGPVGVGRQSFEWDLRRDDGARVAKGVYLITVDGAVHVPGRKVVLR
jgi:hypothetical protein